MLDPGEGFEFFVSASYIPCNNGLGGERVQLEYSVDLYDQNYQVGECIVSESLEFKPGSWSSKPYYSVQQCIF